MRLLFLDTETTSKDNGRLVQIAMKSPGHFNDMCVEAKFKPAEPISYEAMAVHHITNEMVEKYQTLEEAVAFGQELQLQLDESILIAHNAKFDIGVLEREGFTVPKFIDTLKIARHLLPDMPNHQLQYLRYALGLEFSEPINPHDAESDVIVLEALFNRLTKKWESMHDDTFEQCLAGMVKISTQPTLLLKINFGKHAGKAIQDIKREDPQYLQWLAGKPDLDEDLKYTLDVTLGRLAV